MDQNVKFREWRKERIMKRRAGQRRKLRLFDVTWLWISQLVILGMIVSRSNSWYILAICVVVVIFSTLMAGLFWAHYVDEGKKGGIE